MLADCYILFLQILKEILSIRYNIFYLTLNLFIHYNPKRGKYNCCQFHWRLSVRSFRNYLTK